ncbi:rRNA adenine N-6-methyltransferase family protein [Streptomyces sp. NPDC005336]|uniref:rRNA adenine N-6-methyltransferase family protein n=1 Tax=unclassified Streptomyces TaxID=2593676 RepID=UPI0033BC4D5D
MEWQLCGRVPRAAFRPVPEVDGGILRLAPRPRPLLTDADQRAACAGLVELGFSGLGCSLYTSLRRACPARRPAGAFRRAGLGQDVVVAYVTPWQWPALAQELRGVAVSKELMVRVKSRVDSSSL